MNIYDISNPAKTSLLTSMICPGGHGDVSVYKNLMFMSVEMPNGRLDCGRQGFPPGPPPRKAIQSTETSHMNRGELAKLKALAPSLEKSAAMAKSAADSNRLRALAKIL